MFNSENKINSVNVTDFIFYNQPKHYHREEYEKVTQEIIGLMSKCEEIISIYQMGEISAPGISDIDFIFVLKNNPKNLAQFKKIFSECYKKYGYFLDPFIIDESIFPDIHLIFPIFDLKHIYGKKLEIYDHKNKKLINQIMLIDFITFYWPREFLKILFEKRDLFKNKTISLVINDLYRILNIKSKYRLIDVRNLLCRLNSMKYPLRILGVLTNKKYSFLENTNKKISSLRKDWFIMNKEKRIKKLINLLVLINYCCLDLINHFKEYLESRNDFYIDQLKEFNIENTYGIISYKKQWNKKYYFADTWKYFNKNKKITSILPIIFAPNLIYFLKNDKRFIRNKKYLDLLSQRYSLIKKQIQYLNKYKIYTGCFFRFDYPFEGPKSYKFYISLMNCLKKIIQ